MASESLRTPEERAAARAAHQSEIASLNKSLSAEQKKLDDLQKANRGNLDKRNSINNLINSAKSRGGALITFGVIAAVVGTILLFAFQQTLAGVAVCVIGVALIVFGANVFSGWKKHIDAKLEIDNALSDYDAEAGAIGDKIYDFTKQIREHENVLEEIALKEKYARVDAWIEEIETNHIGIYVTSEANPLADRPNEPRPKKYPSYTLNYAQAYINEMVYSTVKRQDRTMDIIKVDESGTLKFQLYAQYEIANNKFDWISEPTPIRPAQGSTFYWLHLSTCQKGTKGFCSVYNNFEDFLEETGITKEEIMAKFL